jgi:predicted aminopeptidase
MLPAVLLGTLLVAGCQTINYYSHAALGQWRVLTGREPVSRVLTELESQRDGNPEAELLYQRLVFSQQVLDFAEDGLALSVDGRYRTYVNLERPAVVWNLFAAPPLSLEPHRWCYPVVGCAPYRGYFDVSYARRGARALEQDGLETYLGPVPAYSTLGWFADPLLSTFVTWPEADLAALLFHELAHGQVWVPGDVAFNESFATFVGRQGLSEWMSRYGDDSLTLERQAALNARRRLLDLLSRTREALRRVYRSEARDSVKLQRKAFILAAVGDCYLDHRAELGTGRFDALMVGLNNARLMSVATYEDLVPAFAAVFESLDGHWPAFYERIREVAKLEVKQRRATLLASRQQQVAQTGDDNSADEVECEALSRHFPDAEFAGGVHDDVGGGSYRQHERAGGAHRRRDHEQLGIHAGAEARRRQYRHEQGGGGRIAGGLGEERDGKADAEHDHQHVQRG